MDVRFTMNSFLGKQILALVRDGDHAHAGEEEAIESAFAGVEKDPSRLILDAGCGRGGTAAYLYENGWGRVLGLDIEAASIEAARERHPGLDFLVCDAADADEHVTEPPDLICMFNAFYCFHDQRGALEALGRVARPGTRMILFDHVDRGGYRDAPLMDAGEPFLPDPLVLSEVSDQLTGTGWAEPDIVEISEAYRGWYEVLVTKIEGARDRITDLAGPAGYLHVLGLYQGLVDAAAGGRLGAAIITTTR